MCAVLLFGSDLVGHTNVARPGSHTFQGRPTSSMIADVTPRTVFASIWHLEVVPLAVFHLARVPYTVLDPQLQRVI